MVSLIQVVNYVVVVVVVVVVLSSCLLMLFRFLYLSIMLYMCIRNV